VSAAASVVGGRLSLHRCGLNNVLIEGSLGVVSQSNSAIDALGRIRSSGTSGLKNEPL